MTYSIEPASPGTRRRMKHKKASDAYQLHSIFPTIQGEGSFKGMPSLFVRFAHCNLNCSFCDTDFSFKESISEGELISRIGNGLVDHKLRHIVFTGGEPMIQLNREFIERIRKELNEFVPGRHLTIQIETNGCFDLPPSPLLEERSDLYKEEIESNCLFGSMFIPSFVEVAKWDWNDILSFIQGSDTPETQKGFLRMHPYLFVTCSPKYRETNRGWQDIHLSACHELKLVISKDTTLAEVKEVEKQFTTPSQFGRCILPSSYFTPEAKYLSPEMPPDAKVVSEIDLNKLPSFGRALILLRELGGHGWRLSLQDHKVWGCD